MRRTALSIVRLAACLIIAAAFSFLSYLSFSNGALDLYASDNGHREVTSLFPLGLGQPWLVRKLLVLGAEPLRSIIYNYDGPRFGWVSSVLLGLPGDVESWERFFRVCALVNTLLAALLSYLAITGMALVRASIRARRTGIAA